MSKTIPIWAAVMNRAVLRLRQQAAQQVQHGDEQAAQQAQQAAGVTPQQTSGPGTGWDCDVHLPPWVSEVEANNIRQRLEGWVDDLLGVSGCRALR